MPKSNVCGAGRDHMEIARAAQWLWQQAGRPAGRYIEFWTKVEDAITAARIDQDLSRDLSAVQLAGRALHAAESFAAGSYLTTPTSPPNAKPPPKTISKIKWEVTQFAPAVSPAVSRNGSHGQHKPQDSQ